jgi:hypothetical protein
MLCMCNSICSRNRMGGYGTMMRQQLCDDSGGWTNERIDEPRRTTTRPLYQANQHAKWNGKLRNLPRYWSAGDTLRETYSHAQLPIDDRTLWLMQQHTIKLGKHCHPTACVWRRVDQMSTGLCPVCHHVPTRRTASVSVRHVRTAPFGPALHWR